jgi:hypothetical protein
MSRTDASTASVLSWLAALLVLGPCIRAISYYQLRRLLTVVDDAVDDAAVVSAVAGRTVRIGPVDVVALRGQSQAVFKVGDRVRMYGTRHAKGPALLTDGQTR